jgi:hypothetical protein
MRMREKAKNGSKKPVNALVFILSWVLIMGILNSVLGSFNFLSFVTDYFPEFLSRRLWLVYLLQGISQGLVIGVAQKLLLRFLTQARLKYWLRLSLVLSVISSLLSYALYRYLSSSVDFDLYITLSKVLGNVNLIILMGLQWRILQKHFKDAWMWLVLLLPALVFENIRWTRWNLDLPISGVYLQIILTAFALLWMSRRTLPEEKAKNTTEAEARLAEPSYEAEAEENQIILSRYQASDA